MASEHSWRFFRAGGVDQVLLSSGEDLANLKHLDQKLWVALACPTKGTEIDHRTLEMIDNDGDHRIRPPEILAAVEWAEKIFTSLDVLFEKEPELAISSLNSETDEGKAVLGGAKRILKDQGKKGAKTISLEDVLAVEHGLTATRFNGDGVIPPSSSDDGVLEKVIEDIIGAVGSVPDRSGKPGIDGALHEKFFKEARAVIAWDDDGKADARCPLGPKTGAAADALTAVEAKIVDYFTRCRLAGFDSRAAGALAASEAELTALSSHTLSENDAEVAKLPLARIEAGKPLPLDAVNPAWREKIATFNELVVEPLLGKRPTLAEADFQKIVEKLAEHRSWRATAPVTPVDKLGVPRLREMATEENEAAIKALLDRDLALKDDYLAIASVEKAVRIRRDFLLLLRNFVSFADFYQRKGAVFQAGTLYLDARSCDLCLYVDDPGKHAALAGLSKAYLAYCDIKRLSGETGTIVAAFTAGDVDNLMVGRNGVFYDRKGQDWDATIKSIVENPISIRQAFLSPYKRLIRLVEEQVAKRAADKEKESTADIDSAAAAAASADQKAAVAAAPPPPAAPEKKIDVGTIAAISIALASVAAFFTGVLGMFLGLGAWMPLGILAVLLAISGPSMLIAWLKLRQRNLGPILDASAWAVNGMVKINVPFGGSLTKLAKLPSGSSRAIDDPYAEEPTRWWLWITLGIIALAAVLWLLGSLNGILPKGYKSSDVFGDVKLPVPSASPLSPSAAPSAAPPK
ncbi:MAG: hypothetical protein JNK04_02040 [Myxococcales bacterium]|nr:hypothetical protein [Myxococcales bacterium]